MGEQDDRGVGIARGPDRKLGAAAVAETRARRVVGAAAGTPGNVRGHRPSVLLVTNARKHATVTSHGPTRLRFPR